jgi:hypothetical protein
VTVEEKVDGANAAISFSPDGQMLLQSRGHYLTGGLPGSPTIRTTNSGYCRKS